MASFSFPPQPAIAATVETDRENNSSLPAQTVHLNGAPRKLSGPWYFFVFRFFWGENDLVEGGGEEKKLTP